MSESFHKTSRVAFTLVELIVVIMIMGIVATVVVPMLSNTQAMQLRANARQIVTELQSAQTASIATRQQYLIEFDRDNNLYQVTPEGEASVSYPLSGRVAIRSVDFNNENNIWFDSMGAPLANTAENPDGLPLVTGSLLLESGGEQMTIAVEPVTGRVSIQG